MTKEELAARIEAEAQNLSGLAVELRDGQLVREGGEGVLIVTPGDEDNTIAVGAYLNGVREELEQISIDIYRVTAQGA